MSKISLQDFEKYRCNHESSKEWKLRKRFLIAFYNKYEEPRLICLSKVYSNIKFLECQYSKAIMEEVDMLEEILEKNYKQQLSHNTFKGGSQKPKKKKPTKSLTNDNSSEVMQTKSSSVSKSSSIISSSSTSLASKNSKPSPSSSTQSYPKSSNTSS